VVADGVEVPLAWYVDTEIGTVKTYDVVGDGKHHLLDEVGFSVQNGIEILEGRLLSRTIAAKSVLVFPVAA